MKAPLCFSRHFLGSALALVVGGAPSLTAQVLMLDFGPTLVTGASQTNSPYHSTNLSFLDTSWNQVQTSDIAAGGLLFSNGGTASGISLNIGAAASGTTLGLANTPSGNSALGAQQGSGVYGGTSPGKDGIFNGSGGSLSSTGFQLGGLDEGLYDVYFVGRNTNSTTAGTDYVQNLWVGTSASSGDFNYSTYSNATINYVQNVAATSAWIDGSSGAVASENYVKVTVYVGAGEFLNLASSGVSPGQETRGFLNMVQIVAVPEPGMGALLLLGLFTVIGIRQHRRMN